MDLLKHLNIRSETAATPIDDVCYIEPAKANENTLSEKLLAVDYSNNNNSNNMGVNDTTSDTSDIQEIDDGTVDNNEIPALISSRNTVSRFVEALRNNCESKSVGKCAKYVRMALNKAGIYFDVNPPAACDYLSKLDEDARFERLTDKCYEPINVEELGIIAVFSRSSITPYGHIQGYTDVGWISDFKQRTFIPGNKYQQALNDRSIYFSLFRIRI